MAAKRGGGRIKTVVYLDVLLLTNFLTAYLLLLAAGALSGQRAPFARMLAGSALAALSALILFAPEQPYPVQVAYKAATALGITAAAFGWRSRRRLVTAACWYAALNIALAGAVLLVILRTGTRVADTANLTVYLRVSPLLLLALSGGLLRGGRTGPAAFHPAGGTHQNRRSGAGPLRPARSGCARQLDTGCHLHDPSPACRCSSSATRMRRPVCRTRSTPFWTSGLPGPLRPTRRQARGCGWCPAATAAEKSLLPGFAVQGIGLITENGVLGLGRSAVVFAPRSFGSTAYEALYGNDFM